MSYKDLIPQFRSAPKKCLLLPSTALSTFLKRNEFFSKPWKNEHLKIVKICKNLYLGEKSSTAKNGLQYYPNEKPRTWQVTKSSTLGGYAKPRGHWDYVSLKSNLFFGWIAGHHENMQTWKYANMENRWQRLSLCLRERENVCSLSVRERERNILVLSLS